MNISSNTRQDIGTNYYTKISDDKILIYEEDETRTIKKTDQEKIEEEKETKTEKEQKNKNSNELSEDEKKLVNDLVSRDTEVRAHESAHQSGGASTGAATYTYQQGPDGKMYAIGGEVSVSIEGGSTPQETIVNAQAVIASALAPADPSGQDIAVAGNAQMMIAKAQQQLAKEKQTETEGKEVYKNEAMQGNVDNPEGMKPLEQIDISA